MDYERMFNKLVEVIEKGYAEAQKEIKDKRIEWKDAKHQMDKDDISNEIRRLYGYYCAHCAMLGAIYEIRTEEKEEVKHD